MYEQISFVYMHASAMDTTYQDNHTVSLNKQNIKSSACVCLDIHTPDTYMYNTNQINHNNQPIRLL